MVPLKRIAVVWTAVMYFAIVFIAVYFFMPFILDTVPSWQAGVLAGGLAIVLKFRGYLSVDD